MDKNIKSLIMELVSDENLKATSNHIDFICGINNLQKIDWLTTSILVLKRANEIYKLNYFEDIIIGIAIPLKTSREKIGINFNNEKELIRNFLDETPSLFFRRKKNTPSFSKKLKQFYLEEMKEIPIKLFFGEGYSKKYKMPHRSIYITLS